MATTYTPPIDLYAESTEDTRETQDPHRAPTEPRENGHVDQPAVEASERGLERVLGW